MVNVNDISNSTQLEEIKRLLDINNGELKGIIQSLSSDLGLKIKQISDELATVKEHSIELEKRIEQLERKAKKNNIVIFGFQRPQDCSTGSLANWAIAQINSLLQVQLSLSDINNIYFSGGNQNSPLVLELSSYLAKIAIFKNVYRLKNTKISVANDLSKKDRVINKVLVDNLREARQRKLVARIKNNKLYIGDAVYTYEQLVNKSSQSDEDVFSPPPPRKSLSAPATPTRPICDISTETSPTAPEDSVGLVDQAENVPPAAAHSTSTGQPLGTPQNLKSATSASTSTTRFATDKTKQRVGGAGILPGALPKDKPKTRLQSLRK